MLNWHVSSMTVQTNAVDVQWNCSVLLQLGAPCSRAPAPPGTHTWWAAPYRDDILKLPQRCSTTNKPVEKIVHLFALLILVLAVSLRFLPSDPNCTWILTAANPMHLFVHVCRNSPRVQQATSCRCNKQPRSLRTDVSISRGVR